MAQIRLVLFFKESLKDEFQIEMFEESGDQDLIIFFQEIIVKAEDISF